MKSALKSRGWVSVRRVSVRGLVPVVPDSPGVYGLRVVSKTTVMPVRMMIRMIIKTVVSPKRSQIFCFSKSKNPKIMKTISMSTKRNTSQGTIVLTMLVILPTKMEIAAMENAAARFRVLLSPKGLTFSRSPSSMLKMKMNTKIGRKNPSAPMSRSVAIFLLKCL